MSLADLKFELTYHNQKNDVVMEFLTPALKQAIEYDRAVGFFSSTSLLSISVGIKGLVENGGRIKMICSPRLSDEDYKAIKQGYDQRGIVEECLNRSFTEPINGFEEERLNILSHLISEGVLDIQVAFMNNDDQYALFHDKIGIILDTSQNFVAFTGSMNESGNAFYGNSETIDVYTSLGSDYVRASEKRRYFERLWENKETNIEIIPFPDSVIRRINYYRKESVNFNVDQEEREHINRGKKRSNPEVPSYLIIRDYQKQAFDAWQENHYRGIYDMATGTGKTYTAIYSIVNLLNARNQKLGIVICCPYQHLVNQWSEDLDAFGFQYIMGFTGSRQKDWKKKLKQATFDYKHNVRSNFCFITTNASFATPYVQGCLEGIKRPLLLVIDEAHNFGTKRLLSTLDNKYTYRLALSATLERHNDLYGTSKLYEFFETKCIEYTLKQAIEAGMLCNYYYHPVLVNLNSSELEKYYELSAELSKYIIRHPDGTIEFTKKGEMILIQRSRIVAGAKMKLQMLEEIARKYQDSKHLLVYCGAATVADNDYVENKASEDELRQVDLATAVLKKVGITSSKFTSDEDAAKRERLKKEFDDGSIIQALVAIRCLDEGVNIPSIDKAIILASSTNPKEYIQRRGRVLRNYPGKLYSTIYDFVTLPRPLDQARYSYEPGYDLGLIKRELSRVKDFAELSLNKYESAELVSKIEDIYGDIDEENIYDEFYQEDDCGC